MKIAFLGLGRMGRELVAHILDAGHEVTVWNRTASAAQPFANRATVAATPADAVAGAEIVITVLFGPDTVREIVIGGALPFGEGTVWVDVTTVSPADAASFAEWAVGRGIPYVHSPVIGSLAPARAGTLGVLLGGDPDAVSLVRPIVSLWADPARLRVFSSADTAATAKLVANLAVGVTAQGVVEALRLGHSGGMSTEEVLEGLAGTALGTAVALKGDMIRNGTFSDAQFSANLLSKDLRLMLHTSQYPLPAVVAVYESLENARRAGRGEDDFAVIAADDRE
ncbi:MAG: hydroxyacid dehydrogenase [Microbacteriaceae bacterium]|jgi:3-hydroxyisobutyrate dehydrogenase|nr:hydroxyacid dehydrogenase [Microbacteriaceae bacterium]